MTKKDLGKTSLGMQANLAGLLSYVLGFATGVFFYAAEKESKFVRFHAMQSIITFGGFFVISIILGMIPFLGWIMLPFVTLLCTILWILLMVKAYQGETFKLPIIGDIAEKNSR